MCVKLRRCVAALFVVFTAAIHVHTARDVGVVMLADAGIRHQIGEIA